MAQTKADGTAGVRRTAALLAIAACAQTTETTLDEEAAKVDMKLSFRDAFLPEKSLTFHVQVKSGKWYRSPSSSPTTLTLKIDPETLSALSGSPLPGVVVWVPPRPMDRLYWYASDPRRPLKTPVKINRQQYIRPSIRYDLTRLCAYASWSKACLRQTMRESDHASIVLRARQAYASLKSAQWEHPLAGRLAVTRLAWRHITRRSKTTRRRTLALRVVPYLKEFLGKAPDRYVCNQGPISTNGRQTTETRYLLCWYRGALSIAGESYSLLVRIKEEIAYPTNWQNQSLGVQEIRQSATLASWWCKKDNRRTRLGVSY